jgi:hypothetical protein
MATLTLSFSGIPDPETSTTNYFVFGSGTSGSGTFSSPWTVSAGDTVVFQQGNSNGTGTAYGFALFTNNNPLTVGSTSQSRTVASGSASTDAFSWQGSSYYITRTASTSDTTPDSFSFTDQTNVTRSSTQTSNQITISGINASTAVSITGGTYSKNGGSYTSSSGTCVNGDTFTVRHTASSSYSTDVDTTLTVGGVSDTFTSTTESAPNDSTPDAFSFSDQTGVARSSVVTSNTITVTGINTAATVTVSGGNYSKNGGAYTSASTTANVNDTFSVRHTSSSSYATNKSTTLTIGGVSDVFTTTTESQTTNATYGVQVYNSSGNVAFNTASNIATFYDGGSFTITNGSSTSPSISVTGLTNSSLFTILIVENNSGSFGFPARGHITKSNGSFTFQRIWFNGNPYTVGNMNYLYTVVKTA